ncbi:uncharacterized protein F4807DRAFT_267802 [Annulohypoxylon truncatum]|uniref:uncharacterized protein n=1 Tax=Annulohypoxylon truncatum TaxID=327061 RepID=UPI0020086A18|nr:uncharacterized protein F4807DRAFT_267802 [Annulohypoxylon truncatum]KAI1213490.1 hypothetical protein F4807DRAFT_267802 [Annulohypoxylon truncatum]
MQFPLPPLSSLLLYSRYSGHSRHCRHTQAKNQLTPNQSENISRHSTSTSTSINEPTRAISRMLPCCRDRVCGSDEVGIALCSHTVLHTVSSREADVIGPWSAHHPCQPPSYAQNLEFRSTGATHRRSSSHLAVLLQSWKRPVLRWPAVVFPSIVLAYVICFEPLGFRGEPVCKAKASRTSFFSLWVLFYFTLASFLFFHFWK